MKKSRNILKEYFERGDKPTEAQFTDLIDSFFHEEDGKVISSIDETDPDIIIVNFSDGTNISIDNSTDIDEVSSVSMAFSDRLRDDLLRETGNAAKTILTVMNTTSGKVQVTSLGGCNEVAAYLSGQDLMNGNIQERVSLGLGEVYIFENLQNGSRITSSEGAYGFSEQVNGGNMSPMPLGCNAFSFKETFFYGFRQFVSGKGKIFVANGAIPSTIELTDGNGVVINGQTEIVLDSFAFVVLESDGNKEYILRSTNPITAATVANFDTSNFYDSRLIMPLTNDGMTWPRSGFISALHENTKVKFWIRNGVTGEISLVTPGSPVDIEADPPVGTGAGNKNYRPNGATRFKASGLVSAYSGADSAGAEATPMFSTKSFVQRVALPLYIKKSGDGGDNGLAFCSAYEGSVKIYQWNQATGIAELWLTLPLTRNSGAVASAEDQLFPAAALTSASASESTLEMPSDFLGGYAEADVPIHCIINSEDNQTQTFRGTSGTSVSGISSKSDESATTGVTPEEIRTEIRKDNASGLLIKKVINNLTETWEVV